MTVREEIYEYLQKLPPSLLVEILDFLKDVESKVDQELSKLDHEFRQETELPFFNWSLTQATRGMENEQEPVYTTADLRVTF